MSGVSRSNTNPCDGSDEAPPVEVETINAQASIVSNLTNPVLVDNGENQPVLTHDNIGQPKTPPARILYLPSKQDLEDGYDSDNQIGPFYEAGVEEEANVLIEEVALRDTPPPIDAPIDAPNDIPDPVLADDAIDKMKVAELRNALKERGMAVTGLKAVLVA